MFGTIRKHQTWLWIFIIAAMVGGLVIGGSSLFYSTGGRGSYGRGNANFGSINGQTLTEEQLTSASAEVQLRYFVQSGRWPDEEYVKREMYIWLLLVQEEESYGIHVGDEAAAELERAVITQLGSGLGAGTPASFEERVLKPRRLDMGDLDRFARHFAGIGELSSAIGLAGKLISPQEATALYTRQNQELVTEAVFFEASNYLSTITTTPEAISEFYSNYQASYRIPPRVQVSYAQFNASNYLSQVKGELTNMDKIVQDNIDHIGTNISRYGRTLDEARTNIAKEIVHQEEMRLAKNDAKSFSDPLFAVETNRAENLELAAKEKGLKVGITAPFGEQEAPKDLDVGQAFVRTAFSLTPEEPLGGPVNGEDGWYIIALVKRLPSEIPPLDSIHDRVVFNYKYIQALNKARAAGAEFHRSVTNAMAQGRNFWAAWTNAGYSPVHLPPFSISTRSVPEVEERIGLNANALKQMAFTTPPGKISNFQPTAEGGLILYVKSKLPLDQAKVQADLPGFIRSEQQRRQEDAFNVWLGKEAATGLRDTPLGQQQKAPPSMGPAQGSRRS